MKPLLKLEKAWNEVADLFDKTYFSYDDGSVSHGDWIGDELGGTYEINDYFFSGSDMVTALGMNIPKGTLLAWYEENQAAYEERKECWFCKGLKPSKRFIPNLSYYHYMVQDNFSKKL